MLTNAGAHYVDVNPAFDGHRICNGSSWLHAVDILHLDESYHPTPAGQRAYEAAFARASA